MARRLGPHERFVVRKRFGDELTDIRHFIRPDDVMVRDVLASRPSWTVEAIWRWVVENIAYPAGNPLLQDQHALFAYQVPVPVLGALLPRKTYATLDFWNFPAETLRDGQGDCEDSSFLMVSMVRAALPSVPVYASVGYFQDFGHVWVSVAGPDGYWIYDTTLPPDELPQAPPLEAQAPAYRALLRFNDREVILEEEPPAIPERVRDLGELRRKQLRSWYVLLREGGTAFSAKMFRGRIH